MKEQKNFRISKTTQQQIATLTRRMGMSQTGLITVAINDLYNKMADKMTDEPIISFDDFTNWHTANGTDTVDDATLRAAYEVYKILFAEGGKEFADDKICGHPVWTNKAGE